MKITSSRVQSIQNAAKRIMAIDGRIWDKNGWTDGGMVNHKIYNAEIKKKVKRKLPIIFYYIFEDANFHTLNQGLEETHKFKGKYGSPQAEKEFAEYEKLGGKTWNIS